MDELYDEYRSTLPWYRKKPNFGIIGIIGLFIVLAAAIAYGALTRKSLMEANKDVIKYKNEYTILKNSTEEEITFLKSEVRKYEQDAEFDYSYDDPSDDGCSYWFVHFEDKNGDYRYNAFIRFTVPYFSSKEFKEQKGNDKFILNIARVNKETYYQNE